MKLFEKVPCRVAAVAFILAGILLVGGLALHEQDLETDAAAEKAVPLPVVMYHHMLESSKLLGTYCITPSEFEADLRRIQELGYTTIHIADLIEYTEGKGTLPERPILLTFDDGYESTYAYALKLLEQYGMKAVVSLIGKYTDLYSETEDHHINYAHITWEQAREMQQSGIFEIMNHTYDLHTNESRSGCRIMPGEDPETYRQMLRQDLGLLQDKIESNVGVRPVAFTYPYGSVCREAKEVIAEMGFQVTLGSEEGINYITRDSTSIFTLKRFNRPHDLRSVDFFEKMLDHLSS